MVETVGSWVLPENSQYRRASSRPAMFQQANFDAQFDALTVFYDCIRLTDTQVMLIGPPLNRFPGILDSLKIYAGPAGHQRSYKVEHKYTAGFAKRRTDNLCRVLVEVSASDTCLHVQAGAGQTTIQIRPNAYELFRGRRVLFTLSQNNHPQWICDWMRFHRDLQSADAVLLYDNNSTAYTTHALVESMRQVSGFNAVCVVAWPFKYGPQGVGPGTWDSAFSQNGVMEDARWRFLSNAYGVLNCDIDELVLSRGGNVFDKAAASSTGYVRFAGRWVTAASEETQARHRESLWQLPPQWRWQGFRPKDTKLCPAKWALAPSRCLPQAHWSVHEIVGMRTPILKQDNICYRHFTRIGTNWKNNRHAIEKAAKPRKDIDLSQAFAQVRWEE